MPLNVFLETNIYNEIVARGDTRSVAARLKRIDAQLLVTEHVVYELLADPDDTHRAALAAALLEIADGAPILARPAKQIQKALGAHLSAKSHYDPASDDDSTLRREACSDRRHW